MSKQYLTTDLVLLFKEAKGGAHSLANVPPGAPVTDLDDKIWYYNGDDGSFEFRHVKCGEKTGYILARYLEEGSVAPAA